ncbi:MAG: hypothetical protein HYZ45_00425 [Burkholderiales bacterium]|nr:hypothetical protein [Burkholderiales bacterium]
MKSFTEAYDKARAVLDGQKFADDWAKFLTKDVNVKELLAVDGPNPTHATGLDKLRTKILVNPKGKRGDALVAAAKNADKDDPAERVATLKMLWHLYRSHKRGAQDVWIYSPPKGYKTWVYTEISGVEKDYKPKTEKTTEVYSLTERIVMCSALGHALAATQKATIKLAALDDKTKELIKDWFADEDTTDIQLQQAAQTLLDGYKKLSDVLNSTTLVFSDEALDRNSGGWKDWAFVRRSERLNVVYIQGAFLEAAKTSSRLWICVETIIHELSHRVLATGDVRYDFKGLKPSKTTMPFAKAITNADTWGYFCVDLAGMLSAADRTKTLKVA